MWIVRWGYVKNYDRAVCGLQVLCKQFRSILKENFNLIHMNNRYHDTGTEFRMFYYIIFFKTSSCRIFFGTWKTIVWQSQHILMVLCLPGPGLSFCVDWFYPVAGSRSGTIIVFPVTCISFDSPRNILNHRNNCMSQFQLAFRAPCSNVFTRCVSVSHYSILFFSFLFFLSQITVRPSQLSGSPWTIWRDYVSGVQFCW